MSNKDFIQSKKASVILTLILLVAGVTFYLTSGIYEKSAMPGTVTIPDNQLKLLENTQLKVTYTPEKTIKLFALSQNNDLATLDVKFGKNIPEYNSVVIGYTEANMMIEEKLFSKEGDEIKDLFGIDVKIEGVISKTGTYIDEFHFVSKDQYDSLNGDENVAFIKFKEEKTPKLFYIYDEDAPSKANIKLAQGSANLFNKQIINSKVYYPVIIGYTEANMMIEEKLFTKPGDTIDGFFGKDVVIVGILEKTNSGLDMMHLVESDFFEETLKPLRGTLV